MWWSADHKGKCVSVSADWILFTGLSTQAASGDGWLEVIHPSDRDYIARFVQGAHAAHASYEARYRLRDARGSHHWVVDRAQPRLSADGAGLEGYDGKIEVLGRDGSAAIHAYGSVGASSKMTFIADRLLEARRLAHELGDRDLMIVLDAALVAVAHKLGQ